MFDNLPEQLAIAAFIVGAVIGLLHATAKVITVLRAKNGKHSSTPPPAAKSGEYAAVLTDPHFVLLQRIENLERSLQAASDRIEAYELQQATLVAEQSKLIAQLATLNEAISWIRAALANSPKNV